MVQPSAVMPPTPIMNGADQTPLEFGSARRNLPAEGAVGDGRDICASMKPSTAPIGKSIESAVDSMKYRMRFAERADKGEDLDAAGIERVVADDAGRPPAAGNDQADQETGDREARRRAEAAMQRRRPRWPDRSRWRRW